MSSAEGDASATPGSPAISRRRGGLFSTLAGRLALWVFVTSVGVMLATAGILYTATIFVLQWADDQVLEQRVETVRDWLKIDEPDEAILFHEVSENNTAPRAIYVRVTDSRLSEVMESPEMDHEMPARLLRDTSTFRPGDRHQGTIVNDAGKTFRTLEAAFLVGPDGKPKTLAVIQTAADTSLDTVAMNWFGGLLIVVLACGMVLCFVLAWRISARGLAPLHRVAEAARQLDSRTLSYRLALDALPEELYRLGDEFNRMLGRLETAYAGLRHYADNAAHELRGPVNKMLIGAEVALNRDRDGDTYRLALEGNAEEARHLARIVDSILFLARAENAIVPVQTVSIDVYAELEAIRSFYEASAEEAGVRLKLTCPRRLQMVGDRVLIQRAVSNLVNNALAHTPRGKAVKIRAHATETGVVIEVIDTGEGIPDSALPFVFDRFYRADKVRSAGSRLGLGLPITKSIVLLHQGEVELESAQHKGTTVRLHFPGQAPQIT